MEEAFLHYIWKFQYFEKADLTTSTGLPVSILHPGILNHDNGPDFQNSKILIGDVEWNGSVEIHINAKDWYHHGHDLDGAYDNVVLHVVWDGQSKAARRSDNSEIPVLELKKRVDLKMFNRYRKLTDTPDRIHCKYFLPRTNRLKIFETFDKVVVERLNRKATEIQIRLRKNNGDWEETCFQLLASNFGFKKNKESFLALAECIPFKILQKHSDNLIQIEAMLFGVGGFLNEESNGDYYKVLQKEFQFLNHKYSLSSIMERHHWRFLRMRPANFPTIRIAQLARLIHQQQKFFAMLISLTDADQIKKSLKVVQSEYWQHHYDFDKKSENEIGGLGADSIDNIAINTVSSLLAAYSLEKDDLSYMDHAMVILQKTKAEKNNIVKEWAKAGVGMTSAFDTQAGIELLNNYCTPRKCLDCSIGINVLQNS